MSNITDTVINFLNKYNLSNKTIVVGFSGGYDSMCLLHALSKIRERDDFEDLEVIAAHFNHNWRGNESLTEQEVCRLFASGCGFEFVAKTAPSYICWESILLDVQPEVVDVDIEKRELSQKDIDALCLSPYVQTWFLDELTSLEFERFINKLSREYKANNFSVDLDKFIADNYDGVFTPEELSSWAVIFNVAAYLRFIKGDMDLAQIFYSLGSNYAFMTNILRKSIYEYYVGKRYILKNQRKSASPFEKKVKPDTDDFELLQLDMIISSIEAKWVDNE